LLQVRVDISEAGEVGASYTESPSTRLPVPIHLRAMPVDYFDVRFFAELFLSDGVSYDGCR